MAHETSQESTKVHENAGFGIVPRGLRGRLTAFEIAVYIALSWRADETGACFPSHPTLAEDAGMSLASVKRTLITLREKGVVDWIQRARKDGAQTSNGYRIVLFRPSVSVSEGVAQCERGGSSQGATNENQMNETQEKKDSSSPSATEIEAEFEDWYADYPRKVGKPAALKAYKAARKKGVSHDQLKKSLASHLPGLLASDKQFQPHPATWLNQGRWADDPAEAHARRTSFDLFDRSPQAEESFQKALDEARERLAVGR